MVLAELGPKFIALCKEEGKLEGRLEGRMEGRLEGRLEGQMEGRLEGELEGERKGRLNSKKQTIFKILPRKLERILPLEIENLIKNSTLEKLEELEDKIFEINSFDDVKKILA